MDALDSIGNSILESWGQWYGKLSVFLTGIGGVVLWSYKRRKAKAEAEKAEIERDTAVIRRSRESLEWAKLDQEQKIDDLLRQIEKASEAASADRNKPIFFDHVQAAEGEDGELLQEAFRRYKKKQQGNPIVRFKPPWQ